MDLQKVLDKKKMKPRNTEEEEGLPIFYLLRVLLFSYLITGFLLLLLAFLLYRIGLSEKVVTISIIGIYVIATFLAGFLAGKKMENRRFIWGLIEGCAYFLILIAVSMIVNHSVSELTTNLLTTFILCAGGGMLGGMLS